MENSDLIPQFCAITEADVETAKQYLAMSGNSLDQAVSTFFELGGASVDSQIRAAEQSTTSNPQSSTNLSSGGDLTDDETLSRRLQQEEYSNNNNEVRERIQPVTETLVDTSFCKYSFDLNVTFNSY